MKKMIAIVLAFVLLACASLAAAEEVDLKKWI